MTVLVGLVKNGITYIGADRGAYAEDVLVTTAAPKMFIKDGFLVAHAGTGFGIGTLAEHASFPPIGQDPRIALRTTFVKSMKSLMEEYSNDSGDHSTFLIGSQGQLFEVYTEDWGIISVHQTAVGSGANFSLGSLYSTESIYSSIHTRIELAVKAACYYSPSCSLPLDIMSI